MDIREVPYNLEAEQLLLAAILINNDNFEKVEEIISSESFYEPLHQKIFFSIDKLRKRGIIANHITLRTFFAQDKKEQNLDSSEYLVTLVSKASVIVDLESIAKVIKDLHLRRSLIRIGETIVNEAYKENLDETAFNQIEAAEQQLFQLGSYGEVTGYCSSLAQAVATAMLKTEFAFKNKGAVQGIPTGFIDLDRLLGGLQNSDLIIVAGRPSMGKTAFAINVALNSCKAIQNKSLATAFFSLEMSSEQIASRMLAMESGINSFSMRSGMVKDEEFKRIMSVSKSLNQMSFYIDDTPSITIATLRSRVRRLCRQNKIGVIFIDYLQLIRGHSRSKDINRVQEVSEVTQGLKAIAKEMNIPIVALSQLSRLVEQREDKKPQLSDLRESGSIEQDADVVMFIFREAYYLMRKQPEEGTDKHLDWQNKMDQMKNHSEIIIAKQRNGPIGNVKLHFDINTTIFKDAMHY